MIFGRGLHPVDPLYKYTNKIQAKLLFCLYFDTSGHFYIMNNLNANRAKEFTTDLKK